MGFLGEVEAATAAAATQQEMKQHLFTSGGVVHPFMATTAAAPTTSINSSNNISSSKNINSNESSSHLELQQFSLLHHHHHQQQQQPQHHHHQQHHQNISFNMMQSSPSSSSLPGNNFIGTGKENSSSTGAYDLGELDQALFLYLDGQTDHEQQRQTHNSSSTSPHSGGGLGGGVGGGGGGMRPPTLNIFPSQPMHVEPSTKPSPGVLGGGGQSTSGGTKRASEQPPPIELSNNNNNNNNNNKSKNQPAEQSKSIKREGNRKGPTSSSEQEGPKTPDPKTLRRLAQNREAARKSRLRKKAYVQQLESSRIRLAQLEQELQRARAQGIFFGGGVAGGGGTDQGVPLGVTNISSDAAVFDLEYTRWLEEHHRLTCELRAAVQEHISENELKMYVDNCLAHYDVIMNLKGMVAKTDVFHLVSGMWKTPAERCFMWMGGFRPSEVIKIILHQIEPLSDQQLMGICGLQQSTHEAEEALSQGLDALQQSLSDVIASDALSCPPNMTNYMGQMALAMNKLSTMENFVRQGDSLRHQTFHRLHQILTTRQAARCFLTIAEYFHRLRALSSLWMARPRQE
ncbi:bZIP transcription factor TGA10-like [Chenopodium quinoa]|uniref:bZIP transcription factor TGA10-like n=1 Tax=Chenopodium quinoa TaxID=63459 RepID=UPI000B78C06F|nr:bZIP transcription factor TGA10-like [Chenopodium quinoa]